jgi:hypothetical protein
MSNMLHRNKNLKPVQKSREDHTEDALYREISEEVHAEKVYRFVREHARLLIAAAISIVVIVITLQLIRLNRANAREEQARRFESAVAMLDKGDLSAASAEFAVAAARGSDGMSDLALWESAMLDLQTNGSDAKLAQLAAEGETRDFRDLALIRLASIRGDAMSAEDFEKFMSPVLTKRSPFYYTGMLIVAQKYISSGNASGANKWLDKIITDKDAPTSIAAMAETLK